MELEKIDMTTKNILQNQKMVMHHALLPYLYDLILHTSLYVKWSAFLRIVRRFRTVSFFLKILSTVFAILETGALLILSTVFFLILLPIGTAFLLGVLLTALIGSKRTHQKLSNELAGKRVYVLFLKDGKENTFLIQNARELSTRGTVLLISPYWLAARGIYPHGFYCTARRESPHIFLVRRYYFFSLRRHVLNGLDAVYLY